jgi:hypothetical protein
MKSHSIVMQHDLNMLEVGPVFDSTDHSAQLLTLLFFAMMYAPGLPLLMPLCMFAFTLYFRVDKLLLCRFYQKPPNIGTAAIRQVIMYLPFAAVLRLGFGVWMLGNRGILRTTVTASQKSYFELLKHVKKSSIGNSVINEKLFQSNTFPLFLLFLFILFVVGLIAVWKQLPLNAMYRVFHSIFLGKSEGTSFFEVKEGEAGEVVTAWDLLRLDDPNRQQSSAYTGEFFRMIKHRDEIPDTCFKMFAYAYLTQLTEQELEEGYKMVERGDFTVKVKIWTQFDHRKIDGTKSKHGESKRTYEVVADHRCYTYNIEKVSEYRVAMQGLREGVASMLEYLEHNRGKEVNKDVTKNLLFEKAGLSSNLIAEYEKRKKNRNVATDGLDFLNDMEEGNAMNQIDNEDDAMNYDGYTEMDQPLVSKQKEKPKATPGRGGQGGNYIAVDTDDRQTNMKTPKTDLPSVSSGGQPTNRSHAASSAPPSKAAGKGNFTFDDFNLDEEMNNQQNEEAQAKVTESSPKPKEKEKEKDDHHKHKKDKHKKKKDGHK